MPSGEQVQMTDREKAYFILGYLWCLAKESKDEGLFKDLTIKEVISLFIGDLN